MGSVRLHCIQTVESDALIVCREHVLFVLLSASCARAISCTPTCKKNRSKNKQMEQTIGKMNRLKNIIDFLATTLRFGFRYILYVHVWSIFILHGQVFRMSIDCGILCTYGNFVVRTN